MMTDDDGMTDPQPPENVRLVSPDGRVIPLETVYGGLDGDGMHTWWAVLSPDIGSVAGWALRADAIPGRTSVGVRLATEAEED